MPGAYPSVLEELMLSLRRLPGIGARTAERLALHLSGWKAEDLQRFGGLIAALPERLRLCTICGNLAESERCAICADSHRQPDVICVVEQALQIPVIERAGCFRGLYHVLGGRIEPLAHKGPDDLRLPELRRRLEGGTVRELILAMSSDVEGEATAAYLAQAFRSETLVVSRIAAGIPVGADLGYADAATLAVALRARVRI